jgi:hypothetical protein
MRISFHKTLWGHEGTLAEAIDLAALAGFDGIEGPPPTSTEAQTDFRMRLDGHGFDYIAEATTGGNYVPDHRRSPASHLDDLRRAVDRALPLAPLFVNTQAGLDAWPLPIQIAFHEDIVALQNEMGIKITVETHRSRSTFNPWTTLAIAREVPGLQLNLDFSHWCAVAERLVMDDDPEMLAFFATRCGHMHARVGYDQGPQVPHPAAPEHAHNVEAHVRWWQALVDHAEGEGRDVFTITPEFGPDGYLQCAPFTAEPVADLWEVNRWMKDHLTGIFGKK